VLAIFYDFVIKMGAVPLGSLALIAIIILLLLPYASLALAAYVVYTLENK
jgi:hypothetical protein